MIGWDPFRWFRMRKSTVADTPDDDPRGSDPITTDVIGPYTGDVSVARFGDNARHADVAILYGLGMEDRAHAVARDLKPTRLDISGRGISEAER